MKLGSFLQTKRIIQISVGVLSAVSIILFAYTVFTAPSLSDDMYFKSLNMDTISKAVNFALNHGNGRYLGNASIVFLMHYDILRSLIKIVTVLAVAFFSARIIDNSKRTLFLSFALTLLCSATIYSQCYLFSAGFFNYVIPVLFLLISVYIIKNNFKHTNFWCALLIVLGFLGALCVEHSSLINCLVALLLCVDFFVKKSNEKRKPICYLAGSAVGTFMILFLPDIMGVSEKVDYYRHSASGLVELFYMAINTSTTLTKGLMENYLVWFIFSFCCIMLLWKNKKMNKILKLAEIVILAAFPVFCIVNNMTFFANIYNDIHYSEALVVIFVIYFLIVFFVLFMNISDKDLRNRTAGTMLIGVISLVMLLPVSPTGPRLCYLAYILFSVAAIRVLLFTIENVNFYSYTSAGLSLIALAVMIAYSVMIKADVQVNDIRMEYMYQQIDSGAEQIELPHLPNNMICGESAHFDVMFLDKDGEKIDFEFVDYDIWLENHPEYQTY